MGTSLKVAEYHPETPSGQGTVPGRTIPRARSAKNVSSGTSTRLVSTGPQIMSAIFRLAGICTFAIGVTPFNSNIYRLSLDKDLTARE